MYCRWLIAHSALAVPSFFERFEVAVIPTHPKELQPKATGLRLSMIQHRKLFLNWSLRTPHLSLIFVS